MKGKPYVRCDDAEERSGIPGRLRQQGCIVETVRLGSGDYLVSAALAVERKSAADFARSLLDGRLLKQLTCLAETYEYGALLVEGDSWAGDRQLRTPLVGELYHWISLRPNLSVLYSPSPAWTSRLLTDLARREQFGRLADGPASAPTPVRTARSGREILLAFPGVGPANADRLLTRFGTVRAVACAPKADLQATIGSTRGRRLHALLNDFASPPN